MSVDQTLDAVELSIQDAEKLIAKSDALYRLEKNKDFKFLFLDELLKEDAIKQVMLLASPGLKAPGEGPAIAKAGIQARIDMIGELYNYCRWVHMEAESARSALEEHREYQAELLKEQIQE